MTTTGRRWALAAALIALTTSVAAQDRVGQLSAIDGEVSIVRAADGSVAKARQVGPRVRNGSVFAGDIVATADAATATLLFSDGSKVDLEAGTSLSVHETDLSALVAAGKRDKPKGRRIKILAGNVLSHVVPNPEVATEFETPSGVAAVKGTTLAISVGRKETP